MSLNIDTYSGDEVSRSGLENPPDQPRDGQPTNNGFKLSPQRWLILFAMAFFGLISAALSEFRAILDIMLELLGFQTADYIYIKQIFVYLAAISALPTGWLIDNYGLRLTMYLATLFMLLGNGFRFLLFRPQFNSWNHLKVAYWIISGVMSTQAAAIYFCTPLKISENWFSESERSFAWTILISAYGIGVSVASFSLPRFVHQVEDVKSLSNLNLISAIVVAAVVVLCITRSKPSDPPSERMVRSSRADLPWFRSVARMLGHRDILLHLVHDTIFGGMNLAADSVIQKILTRSGHSKVFVGNILSLYSLLSVFLLIGMAVVVHRIKNVTLTCKVASLIRTIMFVLRLYSMLYPFPDWVVLLVALIDVVCKCWSLPNNNNMTAHLICGTVSEATVTAVTVTLYTTITSICSVAFVKFMKTDQSSKHEEDYTYSIAMASIVCLINSVIYVTFFKGRPASEINDQGQSQSQSRLTPSTS